MARNKGIEKSSTISKRDKHVTGNTARLLPPRSSRMSEEVLVDLATPHHLNAALHDRPRLFTIRVGYRLSLGQSTPVMQRLAAAASEHEDVFEVTALSPTYPLLNHEEKDSYPTSDSFKGHKSANAQIHDITASHIAHLVVERLRAATDHAIMVDWVDIEENPVASLFLDLTNIPVELGPEEPTED